MDDIYRVLTGLILIGFLSVRMYGHALGRLAGHKEPPRESSPRIIAQFLAGLGLQVLIVLWLAGSPLVAWAQLSLPIWVRLLGAALGFASIPLLFWVHHSLGKQFSGLLQLETEHQLVMHGPYRWVRHPMYTDFYIGALGLLLLTANALVGGVWLGTLTLMMVIRTHKEEAMMVNQFGDAYRAYIERTGRYLPKLL
jgi:protein-S-isoprenylcysteine O-methyltransferase Ste14